MLPRIELSCSRPQKELFILSFAELQQVIFTLAPRFETIIVTKVAPRGPEPVCRTFPAMLQYLVLRYLRLTRSSAGTEYSSFALSGV